MIGTNLANSSDTSKFLPDGVNPRPGGYVMRPTNRLSLFLLIILLLFSTVPAVLAVEPTTEDFNNASSATCDDPPINHPGEITSPAQVPPQVDYYAVDLVAGQFFTIDVDAEKSRISKQRERIATDLKRSQGKLGNEKFVNNAPADVVTQEKQRVTEFERQISQLDEQLERLDTLKD